MNKPVSKPATLHVELSGEVAEAIRQAVSDGDYASSDEAVQTAVEAWNAGRIADGLDPARLAAFLRPGLDRLDQGQELSAAEVFDDLEARYDAIARARDA